MGRSIKGLAGAGEWPELRELLPDFTGKRCRIRVAVSAGAVVMQWSTGRSAVLGVDLAQKMIGAAQKQ